MKLPPGPSASLLKQHWRWYYTPYEFMDECAEKYGDIFTIRLSAGPGHHPMVFIHNPTAIEALFSADATQFLCGDGNKRVKIFLGNNSLLTIDEAQHRRHRRLMTPPFHGERMRAMSATMIATAQRSINDIKVGQPFCVRELMQTISLNIILRTVLGVDEKDLGQDLSVLLTRVLYSGMSTLGYFHALIPALRTNLGPLSWWGQYESQSKRLDRILFKQIETCKNQSPDGRFDILSMLVEARDGSDEALSPQDIRDQLITLLVAGHETTAAAISWALYWIHRDSEVKDKLLAELSTVKNLSELTAITQLPYLTAVCNETLRITPVIPIAFVRMTKNRFCLLDYEFDARTNLVPCIYLAHHRPSTFPDPKAFRPERFLEKEYSQYEFFPFGGSSRKCIGASFAMQEMKLVLALLLYSWKFKAEAERVMQPRRRGFALTLPDDFRLIKIGSN